jgi:hypothetical protein
MNSASRGSRTAAQCAGFAVALFCFALTPLRAPAQSAASTSSQETNNRTSAASAKNDSTSAQTPQPNLKQKLKAHRVITTDDIQAAHSGAARQFQTKEIAEEPSRDPALCDAECAAEAREESGLGQAQEGEWQAQLAAARLALGADSDWRAVYVDGFDKAHRYCVFQDQVRKAPPPSGTDYQSRYERAKQEQQISDMNRMLEQGVSGAAAQMERLADEAQAIDPVRAAIMRVLAARVLNQCPCGCDP